MRTLKVDYKSNFPGLSQKPDSYKVVADGYEWSRRDVEQHIQSRRFDEVQAYLDQQLGGLRDKVIVECGCGLGANLLRFGAANRCIGVDFSMTALRKLRAYEAPIDTAGADIRQLPLRDACADYVLFSRVLFVYEDLRQIEAMLKEARRILKPGGNVIVVNDYCNLGVLLATNVRSALGGLRRALGRNGASEGEFILYYFSRRDMASLFSKADLELMEEHLCNVHMGIFNLTYHNIVLGLVLRSLRRFYAIRWKDHWERSRDARHVNDAYPLSWLGRVIVRLTSRRWPSLGALSLCNVATKR